MGANPLVGGLINLLVQQQYKVQQNVMPSLTLDQTFIIGNDRDLL